MQNNPTARVLPLSSFASHTEVLGCTWCFLGFTWRCSLGAGGCCLAAPQSWWCRRCQRCRCLRGSVLHLLLLSASKYRVGSCRGAASCSGCATLRGHHQKTRLLRGSQGLWVKVVPRVTGGMAEGIPPASPCPSRLRGTLCSVLLYGAPRFQWQPRFWAVSEGFLPAAGSVLASIWVFWLDFAKMPFPGVSSSLSGGATGLLCLRGHQLGRPKLSPSLVAFLCSPTLIQLPGLSSAAGLAGEASRAAPRLPLQPCSGV